MDAAGIQKAETERLIKLKELELQEQREIHGRNLRRILTIIWLIISLILLGIIVSKIAGSSEGFTSGFLMLFYIGGPIIGGGAYLIFKWLPEKENEKKSSRNRGESDFRMESHRFRKRSTLPLRILFGLRDSKTFPALIFMI